MLKKALVALVLFGALTAGMLFTPNTAEAQRFRRGYYGYYGPRVGVYYHSGYYSPYYYRPYYYSPYYYPPVYYGPNYYRW